MWGVMSGCGFSARPGRRRFTRRSDALIESFSSLTAQAILIPRRLGEMAPFFRRYAGEASSRAQFAASRKQETVANGIGKAIERPPAGNSLSSPSRA